MNFEMRMKTLMPLVTFGFIAFACSTTTETEIQTVSGTYSGMTSSGESITLTLKDKNGGFRGEGVIDGRSIVISGLRSWEAVGSITYSDGSSSLAKVSLSAEDDSLTITRMGQEEVILNRGGTPVDQPSWPFSGRYRPAGPDASLASARLVQSGSLVSGIAEIFDRTAAITGRVTDSNKAEGIIVFLDESQLRFDAELSTDGKSLTILGIGDPIVFDRF